MSNDKSSNLDHAIRGGTRTILIAQIVSQLISLGVLSALFRLVSTASFGLIGIIAPWIGLPRMLALAGVQVALIQPDELSQQQKSGLFWLNMLIGIVSALFVVLVGFCLASLYQVEELSSLGIALCGTSLLMALAASHQSLLERRLAMKQLTLVRLTAQAIGGAAGVYCAFAKWEVWALVVQQYVELVVLTIGVWCCESWRPGWSPSMRNLRGLVRFGGYYSLANLVLYVAQNLDKVLLAWFLGTTSAGRAAVGMYCQAFNLMMRPVYLMSTPLTGVFMPGLSRLRSNPAQYAELVSRIFRMTTTVLVPAGIGLALVAPDLMRLMGGTNWQQAGWILAALAPVILVQGMINLAGSIFSSAGRSGWMLAGSVIFTIVLAQGVFAGYWLAGLVAEDGSDPIARAIGVATGVSLTTVLVLAIPYLNFCCRTVGVSFYRAIRPAAGAVFAALMMGALVFLLGWFLTGYQAWIRVPWMVSLGVAAYATLGRREIAWLIGQFK